MSHTRSSRWSLVRSSTHIASSNKNKMTRTDSTSKTSRTRQTKCWCTITSWWTHLHLARIVSAATMSDLSQLLRSRNSSSASSNRMRPLTQVNWLTSWQNPKQTSHLSSTHRSRSRQRLVVPSMIGVDRIRHRDAGLSKNFCHGRSRTIYSQQVHDKAKKDLSGSRPSQAIYVHTSTTRTSFSMT